MFLYSYQTMYHSRLLAALRSSGFRPDYLELRDAQDLTTVEALDRSRERILMGAAWLGRARLIDNVLV